MRKPLFYFVSIAMGCALSWSAQAMTVDVTQAVEMALEADPRIGEQRYLAQKSQAFLQEVEGHGGWRVDLNAFAAFATQVEGGIFKSGSCESGACRSRDDKYDYEGLTPWLSLTVALIKPLYTFGKLENYKDAASANTLIQDAEVRLRQGQTVMDAKRAYYGYLAARDGERLLKDVKKRLDGATDLVKTWLEEESGDVKQADLFALEAANGLLINKQAEMKATRQIALDGLKVITGVGLAGELNVADRGIRPVAVPEGTLEELQARALELRPEMAQVEAGLRGRRALVKAKKAERMPNVYFGVAGLANYTEGRDRLKNPYISDPFNDYAATPLLGLRWTFQKGVLDARVAQEQAELDALVEKSSLARQGIPYQVAEQYYKVHHGYEGVKGMEQASRSARRWMVSEYADFQAGVAKADKVMIAFQGYVLAHADYLKSVYNYNMSVAKLMQVIGDSK